MRQNGRGKCNVVQVGHGKPLSIFLRCRLDDMHRGFNDYLGNKLSFAPIRNPKKILEIGYGDIHLVHVASRLIFSPQGQAAVHGRKIPPVYS
jgi:hypothetical protein